MAVRCARCGAFYERGGGHRCVEEGPAPVAVKRPVRWQPRPAVVARSVPAVAPVAVPAADREARRAAYHREYMREYMRRRRAAAKKKG